MSFFKYSAFMAGGFALAFMGMTFHYQAIANDQLTEILELKAEVCKLKKPVARKGKVISIKPPTLAVQNRNPLNVKGKGWNGQIGNDKFGHARFETWEHGLRAASFVLKNYAKKHKIDTIRGIVERFAEGNREEYIAFLCRKLKVRHDEKIDIVRRLPELLRAMSKFESGERLPEHLFVAYDVLGRL